VCTFPKKQKQQVRQQNFDGSSSNNKSSGPPPNRRHDIRAFIQDLNETEKEEVVNQMIKEMDQ
jgi:hypothetical protein